MRQAAAVFRREIEEKRFVLWTALSFAAIPFLVVALPATRAHDWRTAVAVTAGILTLAIVPGLALILGGTMIGSDLSAGRLSFYFSKPIPAASLWCGKLLAAVFFTYAAAAIVLVPAHLAAGKAWTGVGISEARFALGLAVVALALILIAHACSTFFRARSAFLAVDGLAFALALVAGWFIAKPLLDAFALKLLRATSIVVFAAALIAAVLAGNWQLSRGRTNRLASHAALSIFIWSSLAVILAAAGLFVAWIVMVGPSDVTQASIYAAPRGPWMVAEGLVPHRMDYRAAFLVNASDGRQVRLSARDVSLGAITFSRDGNHAAWTHIDDFRTGRGEVWIRHLNDDRGSVRTAIEATLDVQMAMSDDGSRIAYLDHGILGVVDVVTGALLGSARIPSHFRRWETALYFVNRDVVRLAVYTYGPEPDTKKPRLNTLTISELDTHTRRFAKTGQLNVMGRFLSMAATPDGTKFIVRTFRAADPADTLFTADAGTGSRLTSLATGSLARLPVVLSDGTMVLIEREGELWTLKKWNLLHPSADGQVLRNIDLGRALWVYIGGGTPERIVLGVEEHEHGAEQWHGWHAVIVNLRNGAVERSIPNVRPAYRAPEYEDDPRLMLPEGPLLAASNSEGRIVRIDINTGAVTPLPH